MAAHDLKEILRRHKRWLKNASDGERADLIGASLRNASLKGADLRGADLTRADLSHADLRGAQFLSAIFGHTDLWRANLMGCTITPKALHAALNCKTR